MKFKAFLNRLLVVPDNVSHGEKVITAIGCFIGILLVTLISRSCISGSGLPVLIASMGSSAILIFAVPHGPFSQPWSVVGGQVVSALAGLACLFFIHHTLLAGAVAVSLAAYFMYLLRCLHPPGGATALAVVLGGIEIQNLGIQFAITPVGLNAVILVLMGFIFNNLVPKRSYPAHQLQPEIAKIGIETALPVISPEDLESALLKMDTFIDVAQEDLMKIYLYALQHASSTPSSNTPIKTGHYYSSGEYDKKWSVRQVISIEPDGNHPGQDLIVYRVVTNHDRHKKARCTHKEFAQWAQYEVFRK